MARIYTPEQHTWIAEHFADMTNMELAAAFNERFGTDYATQDKMNNYGSQHKLKKSQEVYDRTRRSRRKYTDAQLEWLRAYIPGHHEQEIIDAYEAEFGERLTTSMVGNLKFKLGVKSGTEGGKFRRGQEPPNKGKTWDEMGYPKELQDRMLRTTFKKGQISGAAAERERPLLDIREEPKNHYLQIKVAPRNAKHPMQNWLSLAQFEWMRANGRDWPVGHRAVFADHDNRNFDPDNIVPVPNDLYGIVTAGCHGHALPWHDRATLEVAITHARVMRERTRLQKAPRECRDCGTTFTPRWPRQARCETCLKAYKARWKVASSHG